jgi:aryl-alcohol dehydrogenase-like predicted oxidoreductase
MDENGWGQTLYRYRSGPATEATRAYAMLAKQYGMSLTELSLRWTQQRVAVTTSLLGVTSMAQLEEDLSYYRKGGAAPLPRALLWEIDRIHMRNRLPIFASTKVEKDWDEGVFGFGEVDEVIP